MTYCLLIYLAASCYLPRDRRTPLKFSGDNFTYHSWNNFDAESFDQEDDQGDQAAAGPSARAEKFAHCQFDAGVPYRGHNSHLGNIDLCQSSTPGDELSVLIRSSMPHSANKVCIIPTTRDAEDNSLNIGRPVCGQLAAGEFIYPTLNKELRSDRSLNGAMVMFEYSVQAYLNCMNPPAANYPPDYFCHSFQANNEHHYLDFNFVAQRPE